MSSRFIMPFADVGSGIKPSSGAQLFFFELDGVTPKDTYSDQLSTPTANANPVVSDSNGVFADIYITGQYKVTLKDKNGSQIFGLAPIDEFAGFNDLSLPYEFDTVALMVASLIVFPANKAIKTKGDIAVGDGGDGGYLFKTAAQIAIDGDVIDESGNHTSSVGGFFFVLQSVNGVVNAKQFGASSDNTNPTTTSAAINAAIVRIAVTKETLSIPEGTYAINAELKHETQDLFASRPNNGIKIVGGGIGRTILQADDAFSGTMLILDGNKDDTSDVAQAVTQESNHVEGLSIIGSGQFSGNPAANGMKIRANLRCFFKNIMIKEHTQHGLIIDGTSVATKDDADTTSQCTFINFHCHENNSFGVFADKSRTSTLTFETCEFRNNTNDGMQIAYSGLRLINCSFTGNGQAGSETGGFSTIIPATGAISRGLGMFGCETENNFNHEIRLDYCDGFVISGGRFGAYKNNVGAGGQRVFQLGDDTGTSIIRGVIEGSQISNLGNVAGFGHVVYVYDVRPEVVGFEITNVGIGNNYTEYLFAAGAVGVTKGSLGTGTEHSNPSFSITTAASATPIGNKTGNGTAYSTESLYASSSKVVNHDNGSVITVGTFTAPFDGYFSFGIYWGLTGFSAAANEVIVAIRVNGADNFPVHQFPLTGLGAADLITVGGETQIKLASGDVVVGLVTVSGEVADTVDIDRNSPQPCRFYGRAF